MQHLREQCIIEARKIISDKDPSHDIHHSLRVICNAEYIARVEGGNLKIIIPAALFHDAITHPKDDPRAQHAPEESARITRAILEQLPDYTEEEIVRVEQAIREHSYSRNITPTSLESQIVQDADRLEATGAIAIMRTFCSTGQMKRQFYHSHDPFCEHRTPTSTQYALDLFYKRLLNVKNHMNTTTARTLAEQRTHFLHVFLKQLRDELAISTRVSCTATPKYL